MCWRLLCFLGQVPVAVEDFSQDGVVRLLGHRAFPAGVESRQVPLDHVHHAVPGLQLLGDTGGVSHTTEMSHLMLSFGQITDFQNQRER